MSSTFVVSVHQEPSRNRIECLSSDVNVSKGRTKRYVVEGYHGVGVVFSRFATSMDSAQRAVDTHEGDVTEIGHSLRGSISLVVRDLRHNATYLLVDPFGGCLIQKYEINGNLYYSSDLKTLRNKLHSNGISMKKSLPFLASVALSGSGGILPSSFEDVENLPPFTYVKFTNRETSELTYPLRNRLLSDNRSIEDIVDDYLEDLSVNINAVSESDTSAKISQITGGMDSRMVMAMILESGRQDQFSFYTGGSPDSLDVVTARGLCGHLGLPMTNYSGVDRSLIPSGDDEFLWALHETEGLLQGPADAGLSRNENAILSGGYGELLRSFYGRNRIPDLSSPINTIKQIFGTYGHANNTSEGIWNSDFINDLGNRTQALLADELPPGGDESFQLDNLYIRVRNRYYVGEISRSLSAYTNRFDPLYSPALLSLASRATAETRQDGTLQLDILRQLSPTLVSLPFDTPRVPANYAAEHNLELKEEFSGAEPRYDTKIEPIAVRSRRSNALADTAAMKKMSLQLNLPLHAIRGAEFARASLSSTLSEIDPSEFSSVFNPVEFNNFLNSPIKWTPQIRLLRSLGANLSWYVN